SEKTATEAIPASRQARITRTAISPRFATSTLPIRRTVTAARAAASRYLLEGLAEKALVHDVPVRDRRLDEPLREPPRRLAADVAGHEPAVAILVGEAAADQLRPRAGVLRGDRHDLVVPRARTPLDHRIEVVARGLDVALHERHGAGAVPGEPVGVEHHGDLPRQGVAGADERDADAARLEPGDEGLGRRHGVEPLRGERVGHGAEGLERDQLDLARRH